MQRIPKRLPFLLPDAAGDVRRRNEPLPAEVGAPALAFVSCAMLAQLAQEDVPSEPVAAYLDRHLGDLRFEQQIELLLLLCGDAAFGLPRVVGEPDAPEAARTAYRKDLAATLRALRSWAGGEEGAGSAAMGLLAEELDRGLHVELLRLEGVTPGVRGYLGLKHDGDDRVLPLHPFVREHDGGVKLFCGLSMQGLRYLSPAPGTVEIAGEGGLLGDFAEFLLRVGLFRRAVAVYRGVGGEAERLAHDPAAMLHASHALAGLAHMEAGRMPAAVAELEIAVEHRPDLAPAVYHLCRAHWAAGERERPLLVLRELLERRRGLDRGQELLGDLLLEKGELADAQAAFEAARAANPSNRSATAKLARVLEQRRARGREAQRPQGAAPAADAPARPAEKTERRAAEEMLVDMTAEARRGAYTPLSGREREMAQIYEILACRRKRHALLLGDAGVGKTALVEELARRIAAGEAPAHLRGKRLLMMSVATLLAGAKYRGQFEERVLDLVKELSGQNALLFIDDVHTIVSSGLARSGTLDTSSLLKPALVRGEIQSIGATTFDEYRANMEKDPSLVRCYQIVKVDEPDAEETRRILQGACESLGAHHHVRFTTDALADTPELMRTALRERAMPDKGLDVLDRAAARVALRSAEGAPATVGRADVLAALSDLSGVPAEKLAGQGSEGLWGLEDALRRRVVGQDHAVASVSRVVRTARLNLSLRAQRPDGVFLFVGPTGVGKTELARALAEVLFGAEDRMIRIDMSEYMEKISSSRLIGAAPGYVGYNDQNQLTDLVRRSPHSLVLLDEVEKADAQMMSLFLQVFDAGRLTDGKGRTVHFSNTTIVMTSNVGSRLYSRGPVGYGVDGQSVGRPQLMNEIRRAFPPEFLNRIDDIVFFQPLARASIKQVALLQMAELRARLAREGRDLLVEDDVLEVLAEEGFDWEYGARQLARTISRRILEPVASASAGLDPARWRRWRRLVLSTSHRPGDVSLAGAPPGRPVLRAFFEEDPRRLGEPVLPVALELEESPGPEALADGEAPDA